MYQIKLLFFMVYLIFWSSVWMNYKDKRLSHLLSHCLYILVSSSSESTLPLRLRWLVSGSGEETGAMVRTVIKCNNHLLLLVTTPSHSNSEQWQQWFCAKCSVCYQTIQQLPAYCLSFLLHSSKFHGILTLISKIYPISFKFIIRKCFLKIHVLLYNSQ